MQNMPATIDIERRDRALIAFTILNGARDGAIATSGTSEGKIDREAREVRTKFSKSSSLPFPVGDDILR
jgi:hypothetical protein